MNQEYNEEKQNQPNKRLKIEQKKHKEICAHKI